MGVVWVDNRLGGFPRYFVGRRGDCLMQIPEEIKKCVVFVGLRDGQGKFCYLGTAFFVIVRSGETFGPVFPYLVTARHVVAPVLEHAKDGKVVIRINRKDGPSVFVDTPYSDWLYHPDDPSVDVAILPTAPSQIIYDYLPIPVEMAATDAVIDKWAIGIGDDVFLTGLFVNHFGRERNLPIVRVGNIALMPDERVQTEKFGLVEAFLVEARSIGGLSGSPVFVCPGAMRSMQGGIRIGGIPQFYWLGLMHGHWDTSASKDDAPVQDEGPEALNTGIAIVVPASKILEVLNQQALVEMRQEIIDADLAKTLPTEDR